jgi:hypothetical protein
MGGNDKLVEVTLEPNYIPGLEGLFGGVIIAIGGAGVLLSAALGAGGFATALRARLDGSAKVFGRGFLGVSAVLVFLVSGLAIVFGATCFDSTKKRNLGAWAFGIFTAACIFMAIEFAVAGALYLRVHRQAKQTRAAILGWSSVVVAVVLAIASILSALITVFAAFNPG